eukprot:TRINITY_DN4573_c0_g1_i7.p1 TRINITY_DN4573_c0_g1~~TRINITY_DN4573_c0_g1_i7.p1  ORF type:complete len:106 (-),score=21.69 TRINITY_DN4573_c0_g1_i7:6-323(-)
MILQAADVEACLFHRQLLIRSMSNSNVTSKAYLRCNDSGGCRCRSMSNSNVTGSSLFQGVIGLEAAKVEACPIQMSLAKLIQDAMILEAADVEACPIQTSLAKLI